MNCKRIGAGQNGQESLLARVCIVNSFGGVVLDTHVAPQEPVTNYRTAVSGIRPEDLVGGVLDGHVSRFIAVVSQVTSTLLRGSTGEGGQGSGC